MFIFGKWVLWEVLWIGLWINSVEEELNYAENQTDAPVLLYGC